VSADHIPELDLTVPASRREHVPVRTKSNGPHCVFVPGEGLYLASTANIPKLDGRALAAPQCQNLFIRGESDGPNLAGNHCVRFPFYVACNIR